MVDPVVDSRFVDGESIDDKDLVAWVTTGLMHIPHSEDVPSTATAGSSTSFLLRPFNFFQEDPSLASYDGVLITPSGSGSKINMFGTPTGPSCTLKNKAYEFTGVYGNI